MGEYVRGRPCMFLAAAPKRRSLEHCNRQMPSSLKTASVHARKCSYEMGSVPRTEDMMPMQGLALAWSGFRTRSLGRGGRRGAAALVTT